MTIDSAARAPDDRRRAIKCGNCQAVPICAASQFYGAFTVGLDFAHRGATRDARKLSSIGATGAKEKRTIPVKLLILLLAVVLAGYLLSAVWKPERF